MTDIVSHKLDDFGMSEWDFVADFLFDFINGDVESTVIGGVGEVDIALIGADDGDEEGIFDVADGGGIDMAFFESGGD